MECICALANIEVFLFKAYMNGEDDLPLSSKNRRVSEAAHNFVRMHISQITGKSYDSLIFSSGVHGKPYVDGCDVHFNLSHCGNLVLAAFSDDEIGADIEIICRSGQSVVQKVFTQGERDYIAIAPSEKAAQRRFCEIWTAKEACLKLAGTGLLGKLNFDTADADGLFNRIVCDPFGSADVFSKRVNIELNDGDFTPARGECRSDNEAEYQVCVCGKNLGEIKFQIL